MNALAQAKRLWTNLLALGGKRLAALALIGLSVFASTGFSGYYLSRPSTELLYSGLDREDVIGIGSALKEAGVGFDVSSDGASVYVPVGQTAQARMTLAEKGLPHSGSVGNELFDKLGSLGLTSFMQEVTKVRAIEGELARTIQMMRGVKAARVHIVLGDEGSFRRERQPPSASVIIRAEGADDHAIGQAIRHLVASAVPNMKLDEVTVLDVEGQLLASGSDSIDSAPDNLLALEKSVAKDLREAIIHTLAPYLGARNFQVSVAARLNADKTQINETIYNPDGRAERSVRTVKEKQNSQNAASGGGAAGVDANIPKAKTATSDGKQSSDATDKKEELTNYEISSKSVVTTSSGYIVNGLSVAVLINRVALAAASGDKPTPEAVDKQVKEIEQLVTSAAGLRKDRGDGVKISVVDFVDTSKDLEPIAAPSFLEIVERQTGTIVSALSLLVVAGLLITFGVRPLTKALLAPQPASLALEGPNIGEIQAAIGNDSSRGGPDENLLIKSDEARDPLLESLTDKRTKGPQRQLQKLVDFDEEHAAEVLKSWLRHGVNG